MSSADIFPRDIWENTDDNTLRLVLADWLDENGEPERVPFEPQFSAAVRHLDPAPCHG